MKNPFTLKQIPVDAPFCNRNKELHDLLGYARSRNNAVIHGHRRLGKTSLVRRVQAALAREGSTVIFVDFFGVATAEELASRLALSVFSVTRRDESLWKKAMRLMTSFRPVLRPTEDSVELTVDRVTGRTGYDLLDDTVRHLCEFIKESNNLVHVVFDEFQEIVHMPESKRIEALFRMELDRVAGSFFFVGSERRLLQEMFNSGDRPFFRSAFDYPVAPLPVEEFGAFITEQFTSAGKQFDPAWGLTIAKFTEGFPHYGHKLAYIIFELAEDVVTSNDVREGVLDLVEAEKGEWERVMMSLSQQQKQLVRVLAQEPAEQLFSHEYRRRNDLASVGGTQRALKQLVLLDLVEKDSRDVWTVIDPIFRKYLQGYGSVRLPGGSLP